jgi:uroporphyrinogen decarboxylase
MDSRTNLIRAIRREGPEWVPKVLHGELVGFVPSVRDLIEEHAPGVEPADHLNLDIRGVTLNPTRNPIDFSSYHADLPAGTTVDEWGVAWSPGSTYHFLRLQHPLGDATTVEQMADYPLPDIDSLQRAEGLRGRVEAFHSRGLAVGCFPGSIFEQSWYIRGMENLLTDFVQRPEMADALVERVTDKLEGAVRLLGISGVDVLILGDDVGSQHGLLVSPALWRRHLKGGLARVIAAAKASNPEMAVFYHTDGDISTLIPEFIEVGVEILNPIQPECMDPAAVKAQYGDRLSFWGTISLQQTMPFGTPEDVREEVRLRIRDVGQGGGLVLSPSHVLEPEVPWENILAFIKASEEYGRY